MAGRSWETPERMGIRIVGLLAVLVLAGCRLHVSQPWDGYGSKHAPAYYFKTEIPPAFSELFGKWQKFDADTIRKQHAEAFLADYQQMLAQVPRQRINFYSDQEMWSIARELSFVTLGTRLLVAELQKRPDDKALIQAVDKTLAIIGEQSLVYFMAKLEALEGIAKIERPKLVEEISAFREIDADLVKAVDAECISFYEINESYDRQSVLFYVKEIDDPGRRVDLTGFFPSYMRLSTLAHARSFDEMRDFSDRVWLQTPPISSEQKLFAAMWQDWNSIVQRLQQVLGLPSEWDD